MDSGDIAVFSSHGPTFDGRLAPQVVATGVGMHSTRGAGSRGGYIRFNGTSFSSPSVAGVAALLMDAVPAFREQPALTRARLMAGAIRPDPWLEDAAAFPATNTDGPGTLHARYGLGKVSARTGVLNRDRTDGWSGGAAFSELRNGEYALSGHPGARRRQPPRPGAGLGRAAHRQHRQRRAERPRPVARPGRRLRRRSHAESMFRPPASTTWSGSSSEIRNRAYTGQRWRPTASTPHRLGRRWPGR